jgi:hypothetical protein
MNTQINLGNTIKRLLEELSEVAQGKQEIKHYHIKQFPLGEDDYISEFKTFDNGITDMILFLIELRDKV